jgi:hypothetical protein
MDCESNRKVRKAGAMNAKKKLSALGVTLANLAVEKKKSNRKAREEVAMNTNKA